jgi:hypothetical protein
MTFFESKIVDAVSTVRRQHSRVPVPIQRKMLLEVVWALNDLKTSNACDRIIMNGTGQSPCPQYHYLGWSGTLHPFLTLISLDSFEIIQASL